MPLPWKHALRDIAIVGVTLAVWQVDAAVRDQSGAAVVAVALTAALLTAFCGYLLHEWGHLLGALAGRSIWHPPAGVSSLFLFHFDPDRNDRRRFVWMSMGGYLASLLALVLFVLWLPLDALAGRIALGLAILGVLATAVAEIPPFVRVLRGAELPRGLGYKSAGPGGA